MDKIIHKNDSFSVSVMLKTKQRNHLQRIVSVEWKPIYTFHFKHARLALTLQSSASLRSLHHARNSEIREKGKYKPKDGGRKSRHMAHGQKTTEYVLYPITTRRSSSLSNSRPIKTTNTGMENKPNISTQNRFSIFAECLLHDTDHTNTAKENNKLHVHPENSPASHKTSTNLLSW
ncbi:hypothetical protein WN51_13345 [Melipona quadrifasciata]|uniref:Uncharacterized protein n=1 Tax=Melipona quadrifasciata TaxID=166423 RepID=A0A0N0BH79_9HYME|nr:hypothetical protein WN51_13345 [Melipona quadrifasciata]